MLEKNKALLNNSSENISVKNAVDVMKQKLLALCTVIQKEPQKYMRKIIRLELRIEEVDILQTIDVLENTVKTYWATRDRVKERAGIGTADVVKASGDSNLEAVFSYLKRQIKSAINGMNLRYIGGVKFDKTSLSSWEQLGSYQFILPLFELSRNATQHFFSCNILLENARSLSHQFEKVIKQLEKLDFSQSTKVKDLGQWSILSREDEPVQKKWTASIHALLNDFQNTDLDKAVLSRKTDLQLSQKLPPFLLLDGLKNIHPNSFYYGFQVADDFAFVGCSPERLFKRKGGEITTEALAGTIPRGTTVEEDLQNEQYLLSDDKLRFEHKFVLDYVDEVLQKVCDTYQRDTAVSVLKLAHIQHLLYRFKGMLKSHVADVDLLNVLHPTPAVGGYPTNSALKAIRRYETHERGWYTGVIGTIGLDEVEFVVGIRCGVLQEDKLTLYAGAGIVEGSYPASEWDEIENKIKHFLSLFEVDDKLVKCYK